MKTAFSYARVSTKEQEEKKNSIPEQFARNQRYAIENDIKINREFSDSNSAFHDSDRVNFDEMIQLALIEKPNYIIFDDSSRFSRKRAVAITIKDKLRSYGINIVYANDINPDINSVAGLWLDGIQEIKNEATSREIAFHTKKGMTGNLQNRDNETGWCYKNGGKAPYGYKRKILNKGFNQKGKPVFKTIWEIDEDKYQIIRDIIIKMYTKQRMSYEAIRDYLNDNSIPNSNGKLWSTSTISYMLKRDRLEEYAGIAIWNKTNNHVIGVKYNDRSEWVICENAHPAIITKEELQEVLERKEGNINSNCNPKNTSDYLLTGKNIEGEFLFTCLECGGHVIGCSTGKKHLKKYVCSNNNHKGMCACMNNWKVEKEWLEDKVLTIIEKNYIQDKNLNETIMQIYNQIKSKNQYSKQQIDNFGKNIIQIDKQIQNLVNAIKNGINPELIVNEINKLEEEKKKISISINNIKESSKKEVIITKREIEEYFYNFQKLFYNSNLNEKKELLKTYISNISFNKKELQIEISLFQQGFAILEQVAGIEPA